MLVKKSMCLLALFFSQALTAGSIDGVWKHSKQPGWIEINTDEGTGKIIANEKYPERVGREILKDLVADPSREGVWTAQVYAEQLGSFKNAEISLPEPEVLRFKVKAGFISRTVEWVRESEEDLPQGK